MVPVNKSELVSQITRTYWSFWLWLLLLVVSLINTIVISSLYSVIVVFINMYVLVTRYQEHKKLRAEYERRYAWSADSAVDKFKEPE